VCSSYLSLFQVVTYSRPKRPRFDDETTIDPIKIDTIPDEMTTQPSTRPSEEDTEIDTTKDIIEPDTEIEMTTIMDVIEDVSTDSSIPRFDDTKIEGVYNAWYIKNMCRKACHL